MCTRARESACVYELKQRLRWEGYLCERQRYLPTKEDRRVDGGRETKRMGKARSRRHRIVGTPAECSAASLAPDLRPSSLFGKSMWERERERERGYSCARRTVYMHEVYRVLNNIYVYVCIGVVLGSRTAAEILIRGPGPRQPPTVPQAERSFWLDWGWVQKRENAKTQRSSVEISNNKITKVELFG